jgi:hypothetical protein
MNKLTQFLIKELLDEPKTVAIYGGGFKPPTKGHFAVAKKTLEDFPEIDELKIFVGGGVRDGITQDESIKIWEIYKNYLSPKVDIEPSVAPVKSVLGYAKENPDTKVYWILGAREGDEEDLKDIENRTKSLSKYPNLEVKVITTSGGISGTKTRAAIKAGDKELFSNLIPGVNDKEKEQIWDLVTPVIKEVGEATLKPYKWEEVDREGYFVYVEFTTDSETEYNVDLESTVYLDKDLNNIPALGVEFLAKPKGIGGSSSKIVVNKGEIYRVMATIVDIVKKYVKKSKAKAIMYSPSKKGNEDFGSQRDKLYKAFISKAIPGVKFEQSGDYITAILPSVKEASDPQAGTALPYGSGFAPIKENDPFGLKEFVKEVFNNDWNLKEEMLSLSVFMKDNGMNIMPLPKIKVIKDDKENASITLYTLGRHPKDVLRSFAHEMVHHMQNLEGRLNNINTTNTNEDGDLPEIEREAYEKGNMMLRNWEDNIKNINISEHKKYNQPITLQDKLSTQLYEMKVNEIKLSVENSAKIDGDIFEGSFKVGNMEYEYSIDNMDNPYKDGGIFYNVSFKEKNNNKKQNEPTGNAKENYIKILSTMYKIIVNLIKSQNPEYIGISSFDKSGYWNIYNNLTKTNPIDGYSRKDSALTFKNKNGDTGKFIVLKRKNV